MIAEPSERVPLTDELCLAMLGPSRTLTLANGTVARTDERAETLEVVRPDGSVLLRYEAAIGRGRIVLGEEQTIVEAADLRLRASGQLQLEGSQVRVVAREGQNQAALDLSPRRAQLKADHVALGAQQVSVDAAETNVRSDELRGTVGRAVLAVQTIETVADVVISTAKNVYQRVEELAQLRAASLRTIVDESIHVKAREILHRAADAYKVRAEKIHLG